MSSRPILQPGPDHPITIEPHQGPITVRAGDQVIAVTDHALVLKEASYPPVHYRALHGNRFGERESLSRDQVYQATVEGC
jgi:uncharacterized protein (DUF427 family)